MSTTKSSRQFETAKRLESLAKSGSVWACDSCYRLKCKCDSGRPCSACSRLGKECVYSERRPVERKKSGPRGNGRVEKPSKGGRASEYEIRKYVKLLETKVKEMEEAMLPFLVPGTSRSEEPAAVSPPVATPTEPNVSPPAEEPPFFPPLALPGPSPIFHQQLLPLSSPLFDSYSYLLSMDDLHDSLIDTFFNDFCRKMPCCMLHGPTFRKRSQSLLVVWAICAITAPWSNHPAILTFLERSQLPAYCAGHVFFRAARTYIIEALEIPQLYSVWALDALGYYAREAGEASLGFQLLGMAIRMALELRVDVDPDFLEMEGQGPMTWLEKQIRRRMWFGLNLEEAAGTKLRDRPDVIGGEVDYLELDSSERNGRKVKAYASEAVWQSVRSPESLPDPRVLGLFDDFDYGRIVHVGFGLYMQATAVCGSVSRWVKLGADRGGVDNGPGPDSPTGYLESKLSYGLFYLDGDAFGLSDVEVGHGFATGNPADPAVRSIEVNLDAWMASMPLWARQAVDTPRSNYGYEFSFPFASLLAMHWIYHASHMLLYLPIMLAGPVPTDPSIVGHQDPWATAYSICLGRARRISEIMRRLMAEGVADELAGYYLVWCAYHSALVLIVEEKATEDVERIQRAREDLETHLAVMRLIAKRSFMGGQITRNLEAIIAAGGDRGTLGSDALVGIV
ncbi:hypothetical protein HK104_007554 [Borealophlyctis nickersoniae]|nr:hypothetical protein HK104_007554 [Borealophlyctis nickersoniae]